MSTKSVEQKARVLGVLASLVSLPNDLDPESSTKTSPSLLCGDLGAVSRKWIDLLSSWNARDWLLLPLGPGRVDRWLSVVRVLCYSKPHVQIDPIIEEIMSIPNLWFDKCPYVPVSAFALNSVFINEDDLFELCQTQQRIPPLESRRGNDSSHADLLFSWIYKQRVLGHIFLSHFEWLLQDPDFVWCFGDALQGSLSTIEDKEASAKAYSAPCDWLRDFLHFVQRESAEWLCHYCFFEAITDHMALRELKDCEFTRHPGFGMDWAQWPEQFRDSDMNSLIRLWNNPEDFELEATLGSLKLTTDLLSSLLYHAFTQFIATRQLAHLKAYATEKGVSIIGDVPIYLPTQSADCWSHPEVFSIDLSGDMKPLYYGGTPPDYWSDSGQLWGTPTYDWSKSSTAAWWEARLLTTKSRVHKLRIDHFRAFADAWSIPREWAEKERTGKGGHWKLGPGFRFFETLIRKHSEVFVPSDIIVEDLGEATEALSRLRDVMVFPRMVVFQFDIEGLAEHAHTQPHPVGGLQVDTHQSQQCVTCLESWIGGNPKFDFVAFTGTHDNPSLVEWWTKVASSSTRAWLETKVGRVAMRSERMPRFLLKWLLENLKSGKTLIVPVQDLLCLGEESRLNYPGESHPNLWSWQMSKEQFASLSNASFSKWILSIL